jgi:hypothetical protein
VPLPKSRRDEPADVNAGSLEVGRNDRYEVVVNHPALKPDENGVGHIVFSPRQARRFARLLLKHASEAVIEYRAAAKH